MTTPIGHNQLRPIMDKLTTDFPNLCKKMQLNKTCQGFGIIKMKEALVLHEYGLGFRK